MNRYVLVLSVSALIGLGILFSFHQKLLLLPMDELAVLFNAGDKDILFQIFKPIFLFLSIHVNVMLFILNVCVVYSQYTFRSVGRSISRNR